ncbi:hypothetical protein ACFL2V_04620 [Pseudomonadota bacterium]
MAGVIDFCGFWAHSDALGLVLARQTGPGLVVSDFYLLGLSQWMQHAPIVFSPCWPRVGRG